MSTPTNMIRYIWTDKTESIISSSFLVNVKLVPITVSLIGTICILGKHSEYRKWKLWLGVVGGIAVKQQKRDTSCEACVPEINSFLIRNELIIYLCNEIVEITCSRFIEIPLSKWSLIFPQCFHCVFFSYFLWDL